MTTGEIPTVGILEVLGVPRPQQELGAGAQVGIGVAVTAMGTGMKAVKEINKVQATRGPRLLHKALSKFILGLLPLQGKNQ